MMIEARRVNDGVDVTAQGSWVQLTAELAEILDAVARKRSEATGESVREATLRVWSLIGQYIAKSEFDDKEEAAE